MTYPEDIMKEALHSRFNQAIEEISDEGVFSPDQIRKLNNAIILMRWGVEEALTALRVAAMEGKAP